MYIHCTYNRITIYTHIIQWVICTYWTIFRSFSIIMCRFRCCKHCLACSNSASVISRLTAHCINLHAWFKIAWLPFWYECLETLHFYISFKLWLLFTSSGHLSNSEWPPKLTLIMRSTMAADNRGPVRAVNMINVRHGTDWNPRRACYIDIE